MYELIQELIAYKYSCKMNHWSTDNYSKHLLYDRLLERIDDHADDIAEKYFMAHNNKKVFKPDMLNQKMMNKDLVTLCKSILQRLENIQEDDSLDEGMKSLLSGIEEDFLTKLALAQLA